MLDTAVSLLIVSMLSKQPFGSLCPSGRGLRVGALHCTYDQCMSASFPRYESIGMLPDDRMQR